MLRGMNVGIFEHLGITSRKGIDKRFIYFDQVLRGKSLIKFRKSMLYCKNISKEEAGDKWNLVKPDNVTLYDFWYFYKADVLDLDCDELASKDRCMDLDTALWFMLVRSMCKTIEICYRNT